MHMDIVMQAVEEMRLNDPVRFNRLVQEGMALELGIIEPKSGDELTVEKIKAAHFPEDGAYAEVSQSVLDGKRKVTEKLVKDLLDAGKDPVDVVTNALMPGIQVQCELYDMGKSYVPEILMSNDATSKGNVASFVAEGDLHDIGKNICAAILKANGFNVIDIGRDVPKEKVLQIVKENNIQLVCGSTLMSTTKHGLIDTALLLELQKTGVSVACGGAAVSKAFVNTFGNSMYTKSPLETVRVADGVCNEGRKWEDYR